MSSAYRRRLTFTFSPNKITRNPVACSHDCSGKSIHQDVKNKTIEDCSLTNTSTILNIPRASLLGFPFASTASFDSTSFPGLASDETPPVPCRSTRRGGAAALDSGVEDVDLTVTAKSGSVFARHTARTDLLQQHNISIYGQIGAFAFRRLHKSRACPAAGRWMPLVPQLRGAHTRAASSSTQPHTFREHWESGSLRDGRQRHREHF